MQIILSGKVDIIFYNQSSFQLNTKWQESGTILFKKSKAYEFGLIKTVTLLLKIFLSSLV
jgi:hypothetical protein